MTIPSSVTSIGNYAFWGCTLRPLIFEAQLSDYYYEDYDHFVFHGLNTSSVIYAYSSEIDKIRQTWSGTVVNIEEPYVCAISQNYLGAVSFSVVTNEYIAATLQKVRFNGTEVFSDKDGLYTVTGLTPNSFYYITVIYKTAEGEEGSYTQIVNTLEPSVSMRRESATQTTMTISVDASSDETCAVEKKGFVCNGKTYDCTKGKVVLRNLAPGRSYNIVPFAYYGTRRIEGGIYSYCNTASLNPSVGLLHIGPTSISVEGGYTEEDAHVSETGFTDRGTGDVLTLTGLTPNTDYTVTYYVKTEEGGNETVSRTFTTPALELTTLQPRCVSGSCAVVAAETNIGEEETNVGFQWKKYDAPESLKPDEGSAAIYGGQLEGYIRNLQPTSNYNVRAFYKSAEGNYYYGDWVTFDPSDFSYFEPTVHTYAAAEVTHSSARMKGYILPGTDAIEEQGFEYWSLGTGAADKVQTVLATGQVMTAEVRDLQPATTYCCRAFVRTAAGTTYGEEQTFTTQEDPTGIGYINTGAAEAPTVTGYYDLSGRLSSTPHRGVNIVRYSDGTTRKVIMK